MKAKLKSLRRQLALAKRLTGALNKWRARLAREIARLEKERRR